MLNIGGIANLTYLPSEECISNIFSSDIGAGNTIMDAYVQQHYSDLHYDKDAKIAASGNVNQALLAALSDNTFFSQKLPKTTGPELFNLAYLQQAQIKSNTQDISNADVMATLCEFTAKTIADSIIALGETLPDLTVYVSGGGIHNPLLMQQIQVRVSSKLSYVKMQTTSALALNPDAKEAVLFALLANETLCADTDVFPSGNLDIPNVTMGKISFPD
jgi:anhydro-N-acetylmuramic acid kinase